jgi:RHS repeat-associated protein
VATNGAIAAHYEYSPFGEIVVQSGDLADAFTHRFSTKPWCAVTGLSEYELRMYSPGMGRWANRDPISEWGGVNLYTMVRNGPLTSFDLFGFVQGDLLLRLLKKLQDCRRDYPYPAGNNFQAGIDYLIDETLGKATKEKDFQNLVEGLREALSSPANEPAKFTKMMLDAINKYNQEVGESGAGKILDVGTITPFLDAYGTSVAALQTALGTGEIIYSSGKAEDILQTVIAVSKTSGVLLTKFVAKSAPSAAFTPWLDWYQKGAAAAIKGIKFAEGTLNDRYVETVEDLTCECLCDYLPGTTLGKKLYKALECNKEE